MRPRFLEMCLKENGLCLFFIYIIIVSSLPAGGWCEAPPPRPNSHPAGDGSHEPGPGGRTDPSFDPAACTRAEVQRVVHGTFDVTAQLNAGSDPGHVGAQQSWRRLQPAVECGDDAMTLTVMRRHAEQLQLDRVNSSSVPLTRLPPPCGYSVRTTATHLSLRVRYDGCHVTQEGGRRLLPLLWRGSSVTASCPLPVDAGLSAWCCASSGFAVAAAEELRVNVRGRPTPLGLLAERCGFAVDRRRAHVEITAPFAACGVAVEDGQHTLSLQRGEETITLSCPVSPLSWAPPFYLAPLYYPHPGAADPASAPRPLLVSPPPLGLRRSSDQTKDLRAREAPSLHPPGDASNPNHHPELPRPGPHAPDPGLDVAEHLSDNLDVPVRVQESDVAAEQLPRGHNLPHVPRPSPPHFVASARPETNVPFAPEEPYVHRLGEMRNAQKRQLLPEAAPAPGSPGLQPPPHSYYFYPFYVQGPAGRRSAGPYAAAADHQDLMGPVARAQTQNRPVHGVSAYDVSRPRPGEKDLLEAAAPCASLGYCSYHVHDCTVGQHLVLVLPDCVLSPAPAAPELNASCSLEKLTSDPGVYAVPLLGCGVAKHVFGDTVVYVLEVRGFRAHPPDYASPVRLMVECRSSPGSPGEVRLHVTGPPARFPPALVAVRLRVASDPSFSRYHPEPHLPLSLLRGRPLYLEVSLLEPPDPDLVLLVHSCVAHTFLSWTPIYHGCSSRGDSRLLPVPRADSHRVRRILVSRFTSLPPGSPPLEDPEIYFLCLTEVCSSSSERCTISCGEFSPRLTG